MSLNVALTSFLVPPANLVIGAAAGALMLGRWPLAGRAVATFAVLGLFLLSLPAVSSALLVSLESPPTPTAMNPTAIIVLAGDTAWNEGALDVGPLTLERERAGAELARHTGLPIIVTGGTVGDGTLTLGRLMANSLRRDFGVTTEWIEQRAQDTRENAVESAKILTATGVQSAYLVTHAWHMKRSVLAFAGTGITVTASPVRLDRVTWDEMFDYLPRASALLVSYYALHEWIGCLAIWSRVDRR